MEENFSDYLKRECPEEAIDMHKVKESLKEDLRRFGIDKMTKHSQALNEVVDALTLTTVKEVHYAINETLETLTTKAHLYDEVFTRDKEGFLEKLKELDNKLNTNIEIQDLTDARAKEAFNLYTKILDTTLDRVTHNLDSHAFEHNSGKKVSVPVNLMQDIVHASSYSTYAYLAGDKMSTVVFNKIKEDFNDRN